MKLDTDHRPKHIAIRAMLWDGGYGKTLLTCMPPCFPPQKVRAKLKPKAGQSQQLFMKLDTDQVIRAGVA